MSDQPRLRPDSESRLSDLQTATGSLTRQLELLTQALEEVADLRSQAERTHTQAELAVVTSLDATNEVSRLSPQVSDLKRYGVTFRHLRHSVLLTAVWGLVGVLILSFAIVNGQQIFSKYCQYPMYLSVERANNCNMVFIGDRHYYPGEQYSNKNPGAAPNSREETNNG